MSKKHRYIDESYASYYEKVFLPQFGKYVSLLLWKQLDLHKKDTATLLDVTASHGYPAISFARRLSSQSRIIAVSEDHIAVRYLHYFAQELDNSILFGRFDEANHLPLAEDYFDAGYFNLVYGGLGNLKSTITDMIRMVKPGGTIAFTDVLSGSFAPIYELIDDALNAIGEESYFQTMLANRSDAASPDWMKGMLTREGLGQVTLLRQNFAIPFPSGSYVCREPLMHYFFLPMVLKELPRNVRHPVLERLQDIRPVKDFALDITIGCAKAQVV